MLRTAPALVLSALTSCTGTPTTVVTPPTDLPVSSTEPSNEPAAEAVFADAKARFARAGASEARAVFTRTEQACELGLPEACVAEAVLRRNGAGTPQNLERAIQILRTGCAEGYAPACTELGVHYDRALGVAWNDKEASRLYRLGADGGDLEGTVLLAELDHNTHREPEAIEGVEAACSYGHPRACLFVYDWQFKLRNDPSMGEPLLWAVERLEAECRGDEIRLAARACLALSMNANDLYCDTWAECEALRPWQRQQPKRTIDEHELYWAEAACALGSVAGCGWAGFSDYESARGFARLERACEMWDHDACSWLGLLYFHDSMGPPRDLKKSISFEALACERGSLEEACRMWEQYCGEDSVPCPPPEPAPNALSPRSER